ncbi:hypothetical protein RD1_2167 [Roseobacter denitrificans OCh 114]|uniref:Uncharacterized protein n=1 Tax=Roseobacter denitrificans (strain ATCC 33942 / OCh 114) TaxID=375451 RepID=Q167T1_ROSDO|nr:hypothetical protein RD1_2167 [Roseobacter denitrificans OCh 114]
MDIASGVTEQVIQNRATAPAYEPKRRRTPQ